MTQEVISPVLRVEDKSTRLPWKDPLHLGSTPYLPRDASLCFAALLSV